MINSTSINKIKILIPFFIFSLLLGCSNPYKNITKTEYPLQNTNEVPYSLPHSQKTLIYKTNINFYQQNISGLLIIKKTDEQSYRIALTTQFGLNIFDFALNKGNFEVVYCIDYLNKKSIISTFEDDFKLLLMQNKFDRIYTLQNVEEKYKAWVFKSERRQYYYFLNKENNQVERIEQWKRNAKKISVNLDGHNNNLPSAISLKHHNIKLSLKLKQIQ